MAEIRHFENRHDVIFFCRGWSDLDKIMETGAKWHVDCGDVVEIETRCRIPIWRTFGRMQWHVIPEPCITLQGAATWWIHCHDSRATCDIRECNNSICHIENRFSPYFIFFLFLMEFRVWRAGAFVSSPIHLLFGVKSDYVRPTELDYLGINRNTSIESNYLLARRTITTNMCVWKSYLIYRTALFSMTLDDPHPRFQGHSIL